MATACASSKKRKHQAVSLELKLNIIAELQKGKSQRLVSDILHVSRSTKRCIIRQVHFPELDTACHIWFLQQRSKGAPISGPLLQEKSLQLFPKIYPQSDLGEFCASSGWLQKFCHRHGIRSATLQGEALSADISAVDPYRKELLSVIEKGGYTRDHIFNADETGLWWKLMPSKSLVSGGEINFKNFKQSKDRVTLLACANASGSCKIPLAFIHKSARPRCFKNTNMECLPVSYFVQKKSWMDAKVFQLWFQLKFLPFVKQFCKKVSIDYKALLLLDNAPAHPSVEKLNSEDGRVVAMFLPANTTSIIQPMDQGILEAMKRRYKKCLLRHLILEEHTLELSIPEILKLVTIRDAVYWAAQSWDDATRESLSAGWNKLLPLSDCSLEAVDSTSSPNNELGEFTDMFLEMGSSEIDENWQRPQEWLDEDDDPGYQLLDDEEIISEVLATNTDVEEDTTHPRPCVTPAQACEALETVLEWLESQGDTQIEHLLLVKKWRNRAAENE
ncbi:Jerky protein homolog-like [Oopsacas minuta]|uniref:Jerky protein homolog-like n=1 Tax=Oopsacas minuta TaxID=111878 RepID=A0AAV7KTL7_9METZ|nr:Jerky protein homolog-like [Oopsacas minuta]